MKKIILICICIGLYHSFYAQQKRDFAYFNNRIDSLILDLSIGTYKDINDVRFYNSILNENEKKKLIDKIEKLLRQKEYANLYRLGHQLLYDMWWMSPDNNTLEIKQKIMELYLQYYFYPGKDKIINSYGYDKDRNFYFTKKSKQRINEILVDRKTEKEYDAWLNFEKSLRDNILTSEYLTKLFLKKQEVQSDSILQQIRDSIYTEYVSAEAKKNLESLQIEPDIIRMIGLLDMKECIPALEQNLQFCIQNKCQEKQIKAYRYALVKLGDKEQRKYILDNLMDIGNNNYSDEKYFDREDFSYFQDDEMIWRYIEVNYCSGKMIGILSNVSIPSNFKTMNDVYPFIKNVPKELIYTDLSNDKEENQWSQSLYEWLMANKDKVEFDYEGEKRFPW